MRKLFFKKILLLSAISLYVSIPNLVAQVKPSSIPSLNKISAIDKKWQQGGIFEGKTPQQEILSARTEYTKKFNRNDGKIDIIFGGPFHYADKNGAWQDIDLNIKPISNPIFKYGNEKNKFISRFAENLNDGVKMSYKNNSIAFGINPKIYSENWIPFTATPNILLKGNIITYKNIYDNIDLEYELTADAILHRMQFNNKNVFTGLTSQQFINVEETIQLPLNSKLKDEDGVINTNRTAKGNIFIVVNEDTIYTIIAAHIWDATYKGNILEFGRNDVIDGVRDVKTSISFLPGNSIKFIASLPTNWLLAPDRIYPITYDPIVYIGNASFFSSNYRYPFNTCRVQRISQILFLKSDLNAGGINGSGVITDIAFLQNADNPIVNNNINVQMQEVAWNAMTTSTLTASGWTTCYGPSTQNYTTGGSNVWRTLSLTNQFSYTNANNLLVQVNFNNCGLTATSCPLQNTSNGGHSPGGQWGYLNASYYGHRWAYSDDCNAPPSPTVTGSRIENNPGYNNFIPATRITINTATCTPVSVVSQPQSQTANVGSTATFTLSANGTSPFLYFWYKNGTQIQGAPSSPSYTTPILTSSDNGNCYYCIIINCANSQQVQSNNACLTINGSSCIPPTTPTGLQQTSSTTNSISLSWNASANARSYIIKDCNTGTIYNATGTTTTISGLTSGNYSFQIIAVGTGCNSPVSNCVSCSTLNSGCIPPATPIGLQQTSSTANSISLSWNASANAQSYIIKDCNTGTTYNATGTTTTISGLTTGNYSFQIIAVGTGCNSSPSSCIACSTASIPSSITIDDKNSVIPPWQREGDIFNGQVNVSITPVFKPWKLEVYRNGSVTPVKIYYVNSGYQQAFSSTDFSNPPLSLLYENDNISYYVAFQDNTGVQPITIHTKIIEKQWVNKNVVYYNIADNSLQIPLKHFSTTSSVSISFTRDNFRSQVAPFGNPMSPSDNIIQVQQPKNLPFYSIDYSNLTNISPGQFSYQIIYNGTGYSETGYFDLTKIGRLNSSNSSSNHIVVGIAGIFNTMEQDFKTLNNNATTSYTRTSNLTFSIASYITNQLNCNTWYIAQGNTNYIKSNAYDLGIALDSITAICTRDFNGVNEIDLITHSKGGLETRALLGSNSSTASQLTQSLSGGTYNFQTSSLKKLIKKVVFLDVPHEGALIEYQPIHIQHYSPAREDLSPFSNIINYLNGGAVTMPSGIQFLNLTGFYNDFVLTDGAVLLLESENPHLGQPYIQLYQNSFELIYNPSFSNPFGVNILHTQIHQNNILSKNGECTTSSYKNIDKIRDFLNGFPAVSSCVRYDIVGYSFFTSASILPNAKIYFKSVTDNIYNLIGATDENGNLTFSKLGSFLIGDSLKIESAGIETLSFVVDSNIINSKSFHASLFHSSIPSNLVSYPSLKLTNQNPITSNSTIDFNAKGQNVVSYQINSPFNQDSIFIPLTLNNNVFTVKLDTGYNKITVKFIGTDTAILSKEVYYFPDTLMTMHAKSFIVNLHPVFTGSKMFVNNTFYKDLQSTTTFRLLKGISEIKFTKYGYRDTIFRADTINSINLSMQPYSYSSKTDSSIYNFNNYLNPQYWKNISVKNISSTNNIRLSAKQYDDVFPNMGLIPQCRKFIFRNLTSNSNVKLRTAIALDQIDTPDSGDVYLLTIKNGQYKKYRANQINVSEYDPEVQKVAFDSISLGANQAEEIVLMKKQAPIMKLRGADTIYAGQPNKIALSNYVADPDSIKGDIDITITNVSAPASDVQFIINGGAITVIAGNGFTGDVTFTLSATHDFITVNKTFILKILPTSVQFPNAFTPNNDGLNDVFRPKVYGKLAKYHLLIYNRNGEKVFETYEYSKGWDGRVYGKEQQTSVFVWALTYQLEGKAQESKRGSVTLIR